jgi:hypothetical protein
MSRLLAPHSCGREWLVVACAYALVVAPFGCQFQLQNPGGSTDDTTPTTTTAGTFVNSNLAEDVLVAGRNATGDAYFVYGQRDALGKPDVSAIVVQPKTGIESFILFKQGRPVYAQGPDGSYLHIRYTEVTATRLSATVTVHDANTGQETAGTATIDLEAAAKQIAEQVKSVTGRTLTVPDEPDLATTKANDRALSSIIVSLSIIPLVLFTQSLVVMMGQIMTEVFAAVEAAVQAVVLAACTPLFLFTSLLGETTIRIEAVPLFTVFVEIPDLPTVTIELD